jgi:hypothetical protein
VLAMLGVLSLRVGGAARTAWLLASAGGLSVLLFRRLMFDHWLPMSSAAKPPSIQHGFEYLANAFLRPETWLAMGVVVLARITRRGSSALSTALAFSLCMHLLAVLLAGGDWMPGFRLLCPLVPLFAWWLAQNFAALWLRRRVLFWSLLLPLLALRGSVLVQEVGVARAAGLTREAALPKLRELLRDQRGLLAAVDVGLLGEAYSGPILDLAGLTEPVIAHARGGHLDKRIPSDWLEARGVSSFLLHSAEPVRVDTQRRLRWFQGFPVERRVLSMPWVMVNYRVLRVLSYHDAYHYVLLTRRGAAP